MSTDPRDQRESDDDGFHEIQLSGKQLVFLCMATTVVSIVIFLCGVVVGRGVRPVEPIAEAATVAATEPLPADPTAPPAARPDAPPAGQAQAEPTPQPDAPPAAAEKPVDSARKPSAPPAAAPAAASNPPPAPAPRVEPTPVAAKVDPPKAEAPAPKPTTPAPAPAPVPAAPAPATAAPAAAKPSGGGAIAVQVGALRDRGDADALARRLSGKGYAVYIVPPDAGTPNPVFKVRVGNYTSPDEANRVKRRLEQEEKLKPWIIR